MRKIFKKMLAGATSAALVATLLVGINVTKTVKADEKAVELTPWTFAQGGQYSLHNPTGVEGGNDGLINSVTMKGTNESITGWLTGGEASINQTQTSMQVATGFDLSIGNTGWDCQWKAVTGEATDRINPWSIQALMSDVAIEKGHIYTVSFKASASKKKYAYVAFGSTVQDAAGNDVSVTPYDKDTVAGDSQIITLLPTEKTFTYTFTNWVSAKQFTTTLMLGAFNAQYGWAGEDISSIVTEKEVTWDGTVH